MHQPWNKVLELSFSWQKTCGFLLEMFRERACSHKVVKSPRSGDDTAMAVFHKNFSPRLYWVDFADDYSYVSQGSLHWNLKWKDGYSDFGQDYQSALYYAWFCLGHPAIEKFRIQNPRVKWHFCGVSLIRMSDRRGMFLCCWPGAFWH
jgi:hypothetical protein